MVEIGREKETGWRRREGGREVRSYGVRLRERRKEVTERWREGRLAGRGRNRHLPFLSAEAGRWETITRSCIVTLLGEVIVRSWYGVKEKPLFDSRYDSHSYFFVSPHSSHSAFKLLVFCFTCCFPTSDLNKLDSIDT